MPKRRRESFVDSELSQKRSRASQSDAISRLSDEIILRIFHLLSVADLTVCERVSRRFQTLALDQQLWKSAYYSRFVLPRARRIPGLKTDPASSKKLSYSSQGSQWLEHKHLQTLSTQTEWKRQYKTRHNWARGVCGVSEIEISNRRPVPPLLVRLSGRIIFTVDKEHGLRAWDLKNAKKLLGIVKIDSPDDGGGPTALAVDDRSKIDRVFAVSVGFENGNFRVCHFNELEKSFSAVYSHPPSSNGAITGLAFADRYLVTMTEHKLLSLYAFAESISIAAASLGTPVLLTSLRSHSILPPSCLDLRAGPTGLTTSIAYPIQTYLSGWTVGLQELKLSYEGEIGESRLCSALESASGSWYSKSCPMSRFRPSTLSYNHPYVLASHLDNTMTLYMVTSNTAELRMTGGTRLWGHTSSISGAHVAGRGKAVSVSSRGGELRVWNLEGDPGGSVGRRSGNELSVQVRPGRTKRDGQEQLTAAMRRRGDGLGLALECRPDEESVARGWVGFDDEQVVVLREKSQGKQALFVYDFT